jgi:hypothetical protein
MGAAQLLWVAILLQIRCKYLKRPPKAKNRRPQTVCNTLILQNLQKSGRQDLNLRPLDPQSSALAKLRHAPINHYIITM